MKRGFTAVIAVIGALVIAGAAMSTDALAQGKKRSGSSEELITASSFDAILAALENNGFQTQLTTDTAGDPLIKSTDDNEPFSVHFYGCTDGKDCQYIQFTSGWDLANGTMPDVIEKWNEEWVWGRAYLDDEGDPWLDLAVNLYGGVTADNFDDTVDWWWTVMRDFEDHIGWTSN